MTEKRFILVEYVNKGLFIQDNADDETQYFQGSKSSLEKVVDLLNSLTDENEQLKSRVEYLERKIQRERTSAMKQHEKWESEIQKENEQLKDKYNEQSVQYEGLEEQVERLLDFKDNVFNLIDELIKKAEKDVEDLRKDGQIDYVMRKHNIDSVEKLDKCLSVGRTW